MPDIASIPNLSDVFRARKALYRLVRRTPVVRSDALDKLAGAKLFFKAESLQVTGSFKARGATNKILSLSPDELGRGLITVSAGNAALGAAYAARTVEADLVVVMPETAVPAKLQAVADMGARIEKDGVTNATEAFERLAKLQAQFDYTLIHPFDDFDVVAGAGTATWELLEECPDLDCLVIPTSGGGLLSGALVVGRSLGPKVEIYGVQPEGADGIVRSIAAGKPTPPDKIETIADGLTAPQPGELNFEIISRWVTDVFTVSDEAILTAMGSAIRELRLILETSAVAGLAGILEDKKFQGRSIGVILTGSNASMDLVKQVI
jgi:threonine dehydratase